MIINEFKLVYEKKVKLNIVHTNFELIVIKTVIYRYHRGKVHVVDGNEQN